MPYAPHIAFTLPVSCVARAGFSLFIEGRNCFIRSPTSKVIGLGTIPEIRGLYRITDAKVPHAANITVKQISINELHRRVNREDLRQMVEKRMATGINLDTSFQPDFCETCVNLKAKAPRKPFPKESKTEYKAHGDKVVADIWGPISVQSISGKEYYLQFQDLFSHEERIHFLKQKSEAFEHYKKYEAWVKVQRNGRVGILRLGCDRGGEFTSSAFTECLEYSRTARHLTVHDSPSSNGAVTNVPIERI